MVNENRNDASYDVDKSLGSNSAHDVNPGKFTITYKASAI